MKRITTRLKSLEARASELAATGPPCAGCGYPGTLCRLTVLWAGEAESGGACGACGRALGADRRPLARDRVSVLLVLDEGVQAVE